MPGSYTLTVQGTDGTLTHSTTVGLTVQSAGDFTISASPTSVSLIQGNNGGSTVTLTSLNGYNKSANLTVSGCPSGATCSLTPTAVTPTNTSALSITTGTATPGSYTVTVKGTDGTLTHSTTVGLTIQTATDFTIAVNPGSLSFKKGNSGSTTVTITGGTAPVVLSVTGLPANVTAAFNPPSVLNGNSTLTVNAKGNAARGTYNLIVSGTNAAATHTANVSLTIQ
jgi:hypothetical protein